ncbi:hypothetical protein K438DRAFT_1759415 [Mycena galopus ATCC 62051]|nr:hypothetical protein K438DRAFT_1759415 [Mycena galopus ATCC 62051]
MNKTDRPSSQAPSEETVHDGLPSANIPPAPFSAQFLDKSPKAAAARVIYLKTLIGCVAGLMVVVFAVFAIYWGSVWRTPHHSLPGWIVDFDGGAVGRSVSNTLRSMSRGTGGISWQVVSASKFPEGILQLQNAIVQEKTWYAITINSGASANLSAAVSSADGSYDSSLALTFMGSEARNENIYHIHFPTVALQLEAAVHQFQVQFLQNLSFSANFGALLSTAPELVARPIYYTINNIRPFDVEVASAVTFVGLMYLLILSFFVVLFSTAARAMSGLENSLTLGSLIRVRIATSFVAYFFISMLTWIGMLAVGLAIEAMITLVTARFIPFFLITWMISNAAVTVFPLQVLPHLYHYGYAFPFYNISRAVRSIVFGTKNDLGLNFGILLAWVMLSCITIPLFQWFVRRRLVAAQRKTEQI